MILMRIFIVSLGLWLSVSATLKWKVQEHEVVTDLNEIHTPSPAKIYSCEGYLSAFFIQPENNSESGIDKTEQQTLKWGARPTSLAVKSAVCSVLFNLIVQDVNRCPVVSMALFPFHEFW